MHLMVYNLSRLLMAEGEAVSRPSYCGTPDRVSQSHPSMWAVPAKVAKEGRVYLVGQGADEPILDRPGLREPRQVKRHPKNFQLMTQPRPKLRASPEAAKRSTSKAA
jgi:asparagine synthetase B (glutamine-hydrolysing)